MRRIGIVLGALLFCGAAHARELRFPVKVSEAESVQATVRLPDPPLRGRKVPILLVFGGFESASQVLDVVPIKSDVALASFDYPFPLPRRFELPGSLKAIPLLRGLFRKTERGIRELVSRLRELPEVDPARIVVLGASFGAPFALAAAAEDARISGLVLVHPFGRPEATLEHVILRSWLPKYGWFARPIAYLLSRLGWWYLAIPTPEAFAHSLPGRLPVLMIAADHDSFIPRDASESLWAAIQMSQARSRRVLMDSDHLMPGADALIEQICRRVLSWMVDSRLAAR